MTTTTPLLEQYDVYDIAYLSGGIHRVIETALVAMMQDGRVRAEPTGELTVLDPRRRHPVEAAVMDVIGPRPRRSAGTVLWRSEADTRLVALAERLVACGLVRGPHRRRSHGPAPTAAGRDLVRRWRARPVGELSDAVLVALQGPAGVRDLDLQTALLPPRPARRSHAAHWDARAEARWSCVLVG